MSVRDPSRRKALKYRAMAALGLGAVVALGDATGANRLVHAASPSGSDPVFSGTGIQFPSLTSDPSALVGNMWYRSDLTAMKYSDGTNAHELAALDLAQTFTAAQTFNGGIVFDAAGSIASTSTFIEADGAGGNMILNAPTGKTFAFQVAGSTTLSIQGNTGYVQLSGNVFFPQTDSGFALGASTKRFSSAVANEFDVYHASGDANPSAQLGDGFVKLGLGGTNSPDMGIQRTSAGLVFNGAYSGQAGSGIDYFTSQSSAIQMYLISGQDTSNYYGLVLGLPNNLPTIGSTAAGTGTLNPLIFKMSGTEAFRITTTPDVQFSTALRMWTGSATSLTIAPATGSLSKLMTLGGGTAPTTVSLTSGTAYTPSTTQNTIITIGGGTVTAIAINGTTTGLIAGTFYLKASDTITVTFSAAPTALQMVA